MKKAQSQIVTAVLLILIVIALAVVVLNFSMNFVKDKLSGTGCFEAVDKVTFTNSNKYTCFNDSDESVDGTEDHLLLQVHIGDINESISGFLIETGGATTISKEIKEGETADNVTMYGGSETLELPGKNEERTYVFNFTITPETVKIYPILTDGQVCEASDILEKIISCKN
jgi:flagellin-like protein